MAQQDLYFGSAARPRDWVTKDRAYTFTFKAYSSGTQQVPSSATITIRKPGGAALSTPVSAASVTVDGSGNMTYTLIAGNTSDLGAGYIADVVYVVSGATYDGRFLFDVVRVPPKNVVLPADLVLHHIDLSSLFTGGETTTTAYIATAFEDVCIRLDGLGIDPGRLLNPSVLRRAIEHRALELFFGDKVRAQLDEFDIHRASHASAFAAELAALGPRLTYDADEGGTAEDGETGSRSTGYRIRH